MGNGCPEHSNTRPGRGWSAALRIAVLLLFLLSYSTVSAQSKSDMEELRRRSKTEAEELQRERKTPDVRLQPSAQADDSLALPAEKPCFLIREIQMEGDRDNRFPWAQEYLDKYSGRCIGAEGLNLLIKRLTGCFIDRGYVTTRVGVPEQDLKGGVLRIVVVPGVIGVIRFSDPALYGTWRSAFPVRSGDALNLRDLEQGLEQLKRVPSQDAEMKIAPGRRPGESDVVIDVKRSKPWRLNFSIDDSGSRATGKLQFSTGLSFDNPLGLNDLLNLGISTDVDGSDQRGTKGRNASYSVPWGYWTFAFSAGSFRYHQTVAGIDQTFDYSGDSSVSEVKIQRVIHRSWDSRTSLQFRVSRSHSDSYLDDTEIEVQHRVTTAAEVALLHRHYIGPAQLDVTLAHRQGVPWLGAVDDPPGSIPGQPTRFYKLETLDAGLAVPFRIGGRSLRYVGLFRGQYTKSPLFYTEMFSIGNRWTVRGFDGELTLAAERGFTISNELSMSLIDRLAIYAGVDHGQVDGPNDPNLIGKSLTGAVIGVRGGFFDFSFDAFMGCPLDRPRGFKTEQTTTGFQVAYQF